MNEAEKAMIDNYDREILEKVKVVLDAACANFPDLTEVRISTLSRNPNASATVSVYPLAKLVDAALATPPEPERR